MRPELRDLHHRALWWPKMGVNKYGEVFHDQFYSGPIYVHFKVVKNDPYTNEDRSITWDVQIASAVKLEIGDLLWKIPSSNEPLPPTNFFPEEGAVCITTDLSTTDVKNRFWRYEYGASKWKGTRS